MKEFSKKQIFIIGICCLFVITVIFVYFIKNVYYRENNDYIIEDIVDDFEDGKINEDIMFNNILVHVTGEVKTPGVIVLKEGSRIIDAIEAAGGELETADISKVNLAFLLNDGDKLYIPSINDKEIEEYVVQDNEDGVIESGTVNKVEYININTATKEELQTLSGIGESIAEKIVLYRKEFGKFKTIEDLKNVPGIGDAKFNSIKDKIKV